MSWRNIRSLGALDLRRKALNQSCNELLPHLKAISAATKGIIFLATPHRGADLAAWAKMANDITKLAFKAPNTSILSDLSINSNTLERISVDFVKHLETAQWNVRSYREEVPMHGVMVSRIS